MTIHLLKLCVGTDSVQDLREWQDKRLADLAARGELPDLFHRTTQTPRQREALLDGGSLYWVIKGVVLVRQRVLDLREGEWPDGRVCCHIILDRELVPTRPQPRRAFQGWRYLKPDDAPADARHTGFAEDVPQEMLNDLLELGLIRA